MAAKKKIPTKKPRAPRGKGPKDQNIIDTINGLHEKLYKKHSAEIISSRETSPDKTIVVTIKATVDTSESAPAVSVSLEYPTGKKKKDHLKARLSDPNQGEWQEILEGDGSDEADPPRKAGTTLDIGNN